jgi:Fic family protein
MTYENRLGDIDRQQAEIAALRPLAPREFKQLKEYYRVGLTYSSNALEGNTLTESETKVVLEDGITIGGKPLKDHLEAVGLSEAFDLLYRLSKNTDIGESDIRNLHKLFFYRIDFEHAGAYRDHAVIITGTDYLPPPPFALAQAMQDFAGEMAALKKLHPVIYAARLHAELVTIHPFVDGNGRTARLLMNLALIQNGYPITIIPPVVRSDYITAVRDTNKGEYKRFDDFISCMVWEAQRDYLRLFKALNPTPPAVT